MERLRFNTDGGSRANPGPAAIAVCFDRPPLPGLKFLGQYLEDKTNNEAEYLALIMALEFCVTVRDRFYAFDAFSDSEMMVRQVKGVYQVKAENLQKLYAKAVNLVYDLPCFTITHVRREFNTEADAICNKLMDERAAATK